MHDVTCENYSKNINIHVYITWYSYEKHLSIKLGQFFFLFVFKVVSKE